MQLLVDGQNCPRIILDFCKSLSEKIKIKVNVIRKRDKNLYLLKSNEYEKELREKKSFETLAPLLEQMEPSDILVTNDIDLATHSIHRVTAVIDPDGLVFTPERLNLLTVQEYLARLQGRSDMKAIPISHRSQELNEQFRQTLSQYLNVIN